MHHLKFFILILSLFTHRLIFLRKRSSFEFCNAKANWEHVHEISRNCNWYIFKNRVKLLQGHIGTLNISCKKKKKWMTYMFHKIYEWSAFHWCELSNFIIACLLSTNQDGVIKSYFLWKTATSVGVVAHNSKSLQKTSGNM